MNNWTSGLPTARALPSGWARATMVYPHQLDAHPQAIDQVRPLVVCDNEQYLDKLRPSMNVIGNQNAKFAMQSVQVPFYANVRELYRDLPVEAFAAYGIPDESQFWTCRDHVKRPTYDVFNGIDCDPKDTSDIQQGVDNIAPLFAPFWSHLMPSLYDKTARTTIADATAEDDAKHAMVKVQIARRIVKRNGGGAVVPAIWTRYRVSDGEYLQSVATLLRTQVDPAREAHADGLLYWLADNQIIHGACVENDPDAQVILTRDVQGRLGVTPDWAKDKTLLGEALSAMHDERMRAIDEAAVSRSAPPEPTPTPSIPCPDGASSTGRADVRAGGRGGRGGREDR